MSLKEVHDLDREIVKQEWQNLSRKKTEYSLQIYPSLKIFVYGKHGIIL